MIVSNYPETCITCNLEYFSVTSLNKIKVSPDLMVVNYVSCINWTLVKSINRCFCRDRLGYPYCCQLPGFQLSKFNKALETCTMEP